MGMTDQQIDQARRDWRDLQTPLDRLLLECGLTTDQRRLRMEPAEHIRLVRALAPHRLLCHRGVRLPRLVDDVPTWSREPVQEQQR